jgi:hypothetical protein
LGATAKGGVIGVLKGTKDVGVEVVDTVETSARVLVKSTADVGGTSGSWPGTPSTGAIVGAKHVGLGAEEAASVAATGASKGRWVPLASAGPSRARTAVARSRKTDPPPLLAPDVLGGLPRLCS